MQVFLKLAVDREEGKQMSAELVGEALVDQLEGESVEVEDSTFSITTAEVVANPRGKGGEGATNAQLDQAVAWVVDAFAAMNPVVIDGPAHVATQAERDALGKALIHLQAVAGPAMQRVARKAGR